MESENKATAISVEQVALTAEIENPHSMPAPWINVPYSQPSLIYLARCPIVDVGVYRETKVFVNSEMLAALEKFAS